MSATNKRVEICMGLAKFFAGLRGTPLSFDEYLEAQYAGDDWLWRDRAEQAARDEERVVFG